MMKVTGVNFFWNTVYNYTRERVLVDVAELSGRRENRRSRNWKLIYFALLATDIHSGRRITRAKIITRTDEVVTENWFILHC